VQWQFLTTDEGEENLVDEPGWTPDEGSCFLQNLYLLSFTLNDKFNRHLLVLLSQCGTFCH